MLFVFIGIFLFRFTLASVERITNVNTETGQLVDELGRSRLFHGVNIVYKAFPYYPKLDEFDVRWSFSKEDVDILSSLGMNAIRLDVSWAAAEPIRGSFNQSYFDVLHRIIDMCASSGIYVLLEWHQDVFNERYCGNGAPVWASRQSHANLNSQFAFPFAFPFPLRGAFRLNEHGVPYELDCENAFYNGQFLKEFLLYSPSRAFEDLYQNYNGIRDSFIEFWKKIASEFKNKSNVLGYEIMNEPWVGQFYKNPTLLYGPRAERSRIQPLYDRVHSAIRSIDNSTLLFFEPTTVGFKRLGFSTPPGGVNAANKSVLSFHYYFHPLGKEKFIQSRISEAKRLKVAPFVTEFDISWDGTLRKNLLIDEGGKNALDVLDTMKVLDRSLTSWMGWEYKTFVRKTGWGSGLFDETSKTIRPQMAKLYSRPYARAIAGTLLLMNYDDDSGYFHLKWKVAASTSDALVTEVFLTRRYHYPLDYRVLVTPFNSAKHWIKGNILYITTVKKDVDQVFELHVVSK